MKKPCSGFTLVELLVCVVIIVILISLLAPQAGRMRAKAEGVKCMNNLRQIGVVVNQYANDNENRFPAIESMPSNPVYDGSEGEDPPKPMYETLQPYGITKESLRCPADVRKFNYFTKEGSSYQWKNTVDEEITSAPKFYGRRGVRVAPLTRVTLATDYENVHNGHANRLYADGHVVAF